MRIRSIYKRLEKDLEHLGIKCSVEILKRSKDYMSVIEDSVEKNSWQESIEMYEYWIWNYSHALSREVEEYRKKMVMIHLSNEDCDNSLYIGVFLHKCGEIAEVCAVDYTYGDKRYMLGSKESISNIVITEIKEFLT